MLTKYYLIVFVAALSFLTRGVDVFFFNSSSRGTGSNGTENGYKHVKKCI
ncbi:hypothetical protein [Clostridium sp.]